MKNTTSSVWGTQETAIAFVRGTEGRIYRSKTSPIVAVIRQRAGSSRVTYALWIGKACKPSAYYSASSLEAAQKSLAYCWKQAEERLAAKAARSAAVAAARATLKASGHYAVGDVLTNSWGYDQTNIDFYQVTHVGAKTIKIRELAQKRSAAGLGMSGLCQPDRFNFKGAEMIKTVGASGRISFEFGGASKWDGKAERYSNDH